MCHYERPRFHACVVAALAFRLSTSVCCPGFSVSFVGSLIGFVYAFVLGYAIGRTIGTIYNKLIAL